MDKSAAKVRGIVFIVQVADDLHFFLPLLYGISCNIRTRDLFLCSMGTCSLLTRSINEVSGTLFLAAVASKDIRKIGRGSSIERVHAIQVWVQGNKHFLCKFWLSFVWNGITTKF